MMLLPAPVRARRGRFIAPCLVVLVTAAVCHATVYEVGPGKPYSTLRAVPWTSLNPGDVVNVYPQVGNAPYYEKLSLSRSGTAAAPITIRGILDGQGNRPILDGTNAIQNNGSVYNNERGLIITGNGGDSTGHYWVIENLELRNANAGGTFYRGSTPYTYGSNAAGVFLQGGKSAVIRNCWIHDNSNGVQTGSKSQGVTDVLIEYCRVENNGVVGSYLQHNFYNGAEPLTVQYCYIGGLRPGADGQNFKDRGSGTVFRYNWLEGGPNGQLDLVDGGTKPAHAYVYGNVIIKTNQDGNGRLCLFGGDSGASRSGTLYFVNNTVITTRSLTYVFQVNMSDCSVQMHNNIVQYAGGGNLPQIRYGTGAVTGSYNWITAGYSAGGATLTNTLSPGGNNPGFVDAAAQDYRLAPGSACIDAGAMSWAGQALTTPVYHYVPELSSEPRPSDARIDIGAYEYIAPAGPRITAVTPALATVQSKNAPLQQMTITFDKDVTISAGHVGVVGVNTGLHNDFTFAYSSASRTATLTWAQPLPNDTYVINVSAAVTAGGVALDGECDLYSPVLPTGNGTAGGAFQGLVYRLAGDVDGDRSVNVFDIFRLAECWNSQAADPAYDPAADLDEDGQVNIFDIFVIAENWNASIPVGP